jgi:hypothetical protein
MRQLLGNRLTVLPISPPPDESGTTSVTLLVLVARRVPDGRARSSALTQASGMRFLPFA